MKMSERLKKPVPPFFRRVRLAGMALTAAGGALTASPAAIPDFLVNTGGYLLVAGAVLVAVSQATVTDVPPKEPR